MKAERMIDAAGLWGALLTAVTVAMTALMRLATDAASGTPISMLPADVEQWARIIHRFAAMGVGLLAAVALVAATRPEARGRRATVAAVVLLTLLLAVVGRHAPGYRYPVVTVIHVAGGLALAGAFWRLRFPPHASGAALPWLAFAGLVALGALGGAADAALLRGGRGWGPLHLWTAAIFAGLALAAAWRARSRPLLAGAVAALTGVQFVLGFFLVAGTRPLAMALVHSLIAVALALLLVSLAGFGTFAAERTEDTEVAR